MVVSMLTLKQARKERVVLERQASALFRALLKSERGRSSPYAHLTSPKDRAATARRVKTIEAEILKIRRQIRRIGAGR
jgi:hypothetical protein